MTKQAEEPSEKVPFSSRTTKGLRHDFEVEMAKRGIRVKEFALEEALRLWLASGQLPTQKPHSTGTSKEQPQIVSESDSDVLKHTSCTTDELAHVARLLKVLRSPKPHLPDAIKMNLEQFSDLHEAWIRDVARNEALPGERNRMEGLDGTDDFIDRAHGEIEEATRGLGEGGTASDERTRPRSGKKSKLG